MRPQRIASQLVAALSFRRRTAAAVHLCRHGVTRFRDRDLDHVRAMLPLLGVIEVSAGLIAVLPAARAGAWSLPTRERQVAELASRGLSNREIAGVIGTSAATVRNQLHNVFASST